MRRQFFNTLIFENDGYKYLGKTIHNN
jgi:hypothetical protein